MQEFKCNEKILGKGDSLWCGPKSKNVFLVTDGRVRGSDRKFKELQLFGPETQWDHYTDTGIEKEVQKIFRPILQRRLGLKVKKISWSEQGMQPQKGWSFDLTIA